MGIYKPIERMIQLQRGTIIRHRLDDRVFVVVANYGNRVTAVANVDITNPSEWLWFDENSAKGKN